MAWFVVSLLLAYLLGSLSGSLLVGRARGIDIRAQGSGNAGGTNAFRTQGWKFALAVVAIDIGKGALAAALGFWLHRADAPASALGQALACTLAATAGHTWPVFFGFRGGKGAATLVGGLLVAWPASVPVLFVLWLLVLTATGYVGLSTMIAALSLLPVAWWSGARAFDDPRLPFALVAAAFIVYTHRANIARLAAGTEHRFERVRVWPRLRGGKAPK
jgi:glycerol-3-phosphate acyltransferase PlsY